MVRRCPVVVVLVLAVCACSGVYGAAWFDQLYKEMTDYGVVEKYCEYKQMRLGVGSKVKDMDDCVQCSCTRHGLGCASMAPYISVMDESECKNVVVNCRNLWVLKADPAKKCPKKLMPKSVTAVGK